MLSNVRKSKVSQERHSGRQSLYLVPDVPVKIGDKVSIGKAQAVVEVVNVPEDEVAGYKDEIKKVQKVEEE